MMSLTLTLLTVGIVTALTSTNIQTAEAKVNVSDCRDDDPDTICFAGGDRSIGGSGGGGAHCEFAVSDFERDCEGGSGGRNVNPADPAVGGGGGKVNCDPDGECDRSIGGEGRHVQGEGDEGSEDN